MQGDAAQLQPENATVVLAVLEERRSNLVGQRTRSVNQLHAVLRELIPGGCLAAPDGFALPTAAHFASYTGAAPIEVASGERARHRLSRAGDRQLNHALHLIALVRSAAQAAPATTTSAANWPRARPPGKPCVASNAGSSITSGESCSATNSPPAP